MKPFGGINNIYRYGTSKEDRRELSCFHQRCIFDHKIYSRKTGNIYLLWFVAQTGVLHNYNTVAERVDAYPLSSGESHAGGFTMFQASDN